MNSGTRGWLWRDGAWAPATALPFTDRAVRYGMAVFETIGVRGGKPLLLESHAGLLAASAKKLLGAQVTLTMPPLDPDDRGVLRAYVTAGDGGPADDAGQPRIFALFEPVTAGLPDHQTARWHTEPVAPFAHGAKTANYWMNCAAQTAARAEGSDHALLCDHEGRLLSAAMGNVFFVHEGRTATPSLSLPVRPGAMRAWVMERQPVREVEFPAKLLGEAEEVFLTNSRLGVMPLQIGEIGPGPVGSALRDRCRRENIVP